MSPIETFHIHLLAEENLDFLYSYVTMYFLSADFPKKHDLVLGWNRNTTIST